MASPARFTFDLDLGHREERGRMLTDNAVAEIRQTARRDGYAEGLAEGERSASADFSRRLADAAERLAEQAAAAVAAFDQARRTANAEAADLAVVVGRKLAAALVAREPAAELEALVMDCLSSLEGVRHLVVRCHPDVADRIRDAVEARMNLAGFTGRLVVIADPELGISDGRVEWSEGGIIRDVAAISAAIDAAIGSYLSARSGSAKEISR